MTTFRQVIWSAPGAHSSENNYQVERVNNYFVPRYLGEGLGLSTTCLEAIRVCVEHGASLDRIRAANRDIGVTRDRVHSLYDMGIKPRAIADALNISRELVYHYLKTCSLYVEDQRKKKETVQKRIDAALGGTE